MDVRATVEQLESAGVCVHCLALGGVDLTSLAGKMTMQVINAVVEFERDLFIKRTGSGIKRAKAEVKKFGRPSALTDAQKGNGLGLFTEGISVAHVAAGSRLLGKQSCGSAQANGILAQRFIDMSLLSSLQLGSLPRQILCTRLAMLGVDVAYRKRNPGLQLMREAFLGIRASGKVAGVLWHVS